MADRHSEMELVQSCVAFIMAHFSEVRKTPNTLPPPGKEGSPRALQ
jgi:hypothetical protein